LRNQRWKLEWLGLFCLGLYMSVTYMRFLFLAAILFTPMLAQRLEDLVPRYRRDQDKPWLNALLMAAAIFSMGVRFPSAPELAGDIARSYPAKAIAPLQALVREQPGRVLNDYLWGGYLIWNCRDVPVFIDSRVDIFEYHGFLREYMDFATLRDPLERLDQEQIRYVFIGSHVPVAYLLKRTPTWKVRYSDDVAILFERAQPATPVAEPGGPAPPPASPPARPVQVR
jgi:hypothetical protein